MTLGLLGVAVEDSGDFARAAQLFDEALALIDAPGIAGLSTTLAISLRSHRGVCAWGLGEIPFARDLWEKTLADARAVGDWWWVANCLGYLGLVAVERKAVDEAASRQHESLSILWRLNAMDDLAGAISGAACVASARADHLLAVRLFSAADGLRTRIGSRVPPPERDVFRLFHERSRAALTDDQASAAATAGLALPIDQAVSEALAALQSPVDGRAPGSSGTGITLTQRERDVMRLLIAGQTDREIAESLFISPRTAQGHVARLFDKLDVSTRTAAVALAIQQDLLRR
jgi:non-specific serine/threonine protein kinase